VVVECVCTIGAAAQVGQPVRCHLCIHGASSMAIAEIRLLPAAPVGATNIPHVCLLETCASCSQGNAMDAMRVAVNCYPTLWRCPDQIIIKNDHHADARCRALNDTQLTGTLPPEWGEAEGFEKLDAL
jgi:hypothetical protein